MANAVLLVNLGSPEAATPAAVRDFLREFLSDRRVVNIPRLIWLPVLYGIILTLRPKRVVKKYASIWSENGSPLRVLTASLTANLEHLSANALGDSAPLVNYAYTYGEPSIAGALDDLHARGAERVLVIPLYPQFSGTTTGAVIDQCDAYRNQHRYFSQPGQLEVVEQYYDDERWVEAIAESITAFRHSNEAGQKLVFSYHGIPQRNVDLGDPYGQQCADASAAIAARLGLNSDQWIMTFQSRFGPAQWLEPATDTVLESLPEDGVTDVDIACPSFAVDCLETLEEIQQEGEEIFLEAGGKNLRYIPCLNDSNDHADVLLGIVSRHFHLTT